MNGALTCRRLETRTTLVSSSRHADAPAAGRLHTVLASDTTQARYSHSCRQVARCYVANYSGKSNHRATSVNYCRSRRQAGRRISQLAHAGAHRRTNKLKTYRVAKKRGHRLMTIFLPSLNRFKEFFHWILDTKNPTAPCICCYTTL